MNNLGISQCKTHQTISLNNNLLIDNKSSKIDSQLVTVTNQSKTDANDFFHNPTKNQSNSHNVIPHLQFNTHISTPFLRTNNIQLTQHNSSKKMNLESLKQSKFLSYRPQQQISTLKDESNPLISLSKTKLIRKENTIIKKVLPLSKNNEPILPLISLSKTKLVRKQLTPNPKRTSISKKSQFNSLVSISKTKLIRKNDSNPISDSNQEENKILKYSNKPNLNTFFIAVSRNKLFVKLKL